MSIVETAPAGAGSQGEPPRSSRLKHGLRRMVGSLWFRALVTVGLLSLVALQVDWGVAAERLRGGQFWWFAAAVGVLAGALVIGGLRWHLLLRRAGLGASPFQTARAYAIGVFSNNLLPSGFGGDAARAWIVGRSGPPLVRALISVAVDRGSSLVCLFVVAWGALALTPGSVPGVLVSILLVATLAGAVAATILLLLVLRGRGGIARRLPYRLSRWLLEARGTLHAYFTEAPLVASVLALGVAFQALVVAETVLLAKAIDLQLAYALAAVTLPLVLVLTLIPVSLAGFGVREGGFVVLLGTAGVDPTAATLLSLLTIAGLAAASSPGAFALLARGSRPPAHPEEALERALEGRPADPA